MSELYVIKKGNCKNCQGGKVNGKFVDGKPSRVPCKTCRGTRFLLEAVDLDAVVLKALQRLRFDSVPDTMTGYKLEGVRLAGTEAG